MDTAEYLPMFPVSATLAGDCAVAGLRVAVVAEAVGDSRGRTVKVDVTSEAVSVREAGGAEEVLAT